MNLTSDQAYMPNTGAEDQRHFLSLARLWPGVLDSPSTFPFTQDSVTLSSVTGASAKWVKAPTSSELELLVAKLCSQEVRRYEAWSTVLPFGSQLPELFAIVSGHYARVWARVREDKIQSVIPVIQPLTKGVFGSANALVPAIDGRIDTGKVSSEEQIVEMVICRKPGVVIRIKSPFDFLDFDSLSKEVARSRDADMRWLQDQLFKLQSNEERARAMIRSLTGLKALSKLDKETYVFQCPFSQSALAESLEMSDNTLRPYLKSRDFEWTGGKFLLYSSFAESTKREMGLTLQD